MRVRSLTRAAAVYLLAGFVTNLLLAWWLASRHMEEGGWAVSRTIGSSGRVYCWVNEGVGAEEVVAILPQGRREHLPYLGRAPRWARDRARAALQDPAVLKVRLWAFGFPWLSMSHMRTEGYYWMSPRAELKWPEGMPLGLSGDTIPLKPMLLGTTINTLTYAGLFFGLVAGVRGYVGYRRRESCLCPRCQFDLRATPSRRCPECGWRHPLT